MKTKTLVACATVAAALATPSWATQPTGPQGTQLYGQRPGTMLTFAELDLNGDGVISPDEYRAAERLAPTRGAYNGFSADTNPPVPAP